MVNWKVIIIISLVLSCDVFTTYSLKVKAKCVNAFHMQSRVTNRIVSHDRAGGHFLLHKTLIVVCK